MSQNTVLIRRLRKATELSDWTIELLINSEEQLVVPIRRNGKINIGEKLLQTIEAIKDFPQYYPFEYNLMQVKNKDSKEAIIDIVGSTTMSVDITLNTQKYIIKNIEQSNWVSETEYIKGIRNLTFSQSINKLNSSATLDFEEYRILDWDENPNRFWLFFEPNKIKAISGKSFEGIVSGYVWPERVSVPKQILGQTIIEEFQEIKVQYEGIATISERDIEPSEKYQLPMHKIKEIEEEAKNFNDLLLRESKIVAVSLQYNTKDMFFISSPSGEGVSGVVYATQYKTIREAQEAMINNSFEGYNLNKEMLKPLYSKYKELLSNYKNSQPMPIVTYDGYSNYDLNKAINTIKWEEELSISNNPIQYHNVSAIIDGVPLNDLEYEVATKEVVDLIVLEARKKVAVYNLEGSLDSVNIPNNPLAGNQPPINIQGNTSLLPDYINKLSTSNKRTIQDSNKKRNKLPTANIQGITTNLPNYANTATGKLTENTRNPLSRYTSDATRNILTQGPRKTENTNTGNGYYYNRDGNGVTVSPERKINIESDAQNRAGSSNYSDSLGASNLVIGNPYSRNTGNDDSLENRRTTAGNTGAGFELTGHITSFTNNINPIPPFDDRVYSGEFYRKHIDGKEELPYEYTKMVRIGDVMLPIPPTSIKMDRIQQGRKVHAMRSASSLQVNAGSSRNVLTLNIYFASLEDVNGIKREGHISLDGRRVPYYMDGLRPLIAQFKKAPFLPIDNEYINLSLGIHNVVLRNLQVQTVPGFPEALKATLILEEFDLQPYIIGEKQLGALINYPLLRYHYQRSLHKVHTKEEEPYKTLLPAISKLDNQFTFSIIDESALVTTHSLNKTLRGMMTPIQYKDSLTIAAGAEGTPNVGENGELPEGSTRGNEFGQNKELFDAYSDAIGQYNAYIDEWNNKTLMKKYGLENKYKTKEEMPILLNGFYDRNDTQWTKEEILFGNELAIKMYSKDAEASEREIKYFDEDRKVATLTLSPISSAPFPMQKGSSKKLRSHFLPKQIYSVIGGKTLDSETLNLFFATLGRQQKDVFFLIPNGPAGLEETEKEYLRLQKLDKSSSRKIALNVQSGYLFDADNSEARKAIENIKEIFGKNIRLITEYEKEYNSIVEKLNRSEANMRMTDYILDDLVPISMTISLENKFSTAQVQTAETPTVQFFGAVDPEIMISFETNSAGVARLETLFRKVGRYNKMYREGIVTGFLGIKNPLVQLFGIENINPSSVQYDTVEGHPERKIVTIVASAFNKTQRRQESIYGFFGGDLDETKKDRIYSNYDPEKDRQFVNRYMSQMELYPDLELPKVSELNDALPSIPGISMKKFPNPASQVFLDPDFYVCTNTTLKTIIHEVLREKEDIEIRMNDTNGYQLDVSKEKERKMSNFPMTGKSAVEFEADAAKSTVTDSNIMWENYTNEQKFQPVIIGITHGPLIEGGGGGGGSSSGSFSDSDSGGFAGTPLEIPNELLKVPTENKVVEASNMTGGEGNELKGITIHETGDPNPGHDAEWMHRYQLSLRTSGEEVKSWHYQVDDKKAIQTYAHSVKCYHAGDGSTPGGGNMASIGIEMCINSDGNYVQTLNNAAALMAALCFTYNWNPLTDIKTHQDRSGKYCPNDLLNGRDGWSVKKLYELTDKKLQQLKTENKQGGTTSSVVGRATKNANKIPDYIEWIEWNTNKGKNLKEYEDWQRAIASNKINQEEFSYKLSDLVLKYFGNDLLAGDEEILHLKERTAPYKNKVDPINIEAEYRQDTALGILSFAGLEEVYALRMSRKKSGDLLKHGRKPVTLSSSNFISSLKNEELERDSLQRIMLYLKSLIMIESGGAIHDGTNKPILKDKNSNGEWSRGGFAGAKLTTVANVVELQQVLWDWEYNLEKVIQQISSVYKLAKSHPKKEIRYQALEWAIASHSWTELPKYLLSQQESDDIAIGYNGGEINVLRNNYLLRVEEKARQMVETKWSDDNNKLLYTDLYGRSVSALQLTYKGLADNRSVATRNNDLSNNTNGRYITSRLDEIANTRARAEAENEVARQIAAGTTNPVDKEIVINELTLKKRDKIKKQLQENATPTRNTSNTESNNSNAENVEGEQIDSDLTEDDITTWNATARYNAWSPIQSNEGMWHDAMAYNQTGRLLRAFPTYIVQLVDEGKWFTNFRTWDNFYGYSSILSIDIYKSRKIVADTAVLTMTNMYGGLTSQTKDMGFKDLEKPSFFSSMFWDRYVLNNPTEEIFEQRKNIATTLNLKAGARLHVRMGYGANPFGLPIMFNGVISEVSTGEVVTIAAQGDGIELTNAIAGEEGEDNKSIFGDVKAPRDVVGRVMTTKGNWIKDVLNKVSGSYIFRNVPSGIAHFGAAIEAAEGNLVPWSDEYGESMINFYTNDGSGNKTKFLDGENGTVDGVEQTISQIQEGLVANLFSEEETFNEDNILVNLYGNSIWDIIQTFALCSPDYHAAVVPFEYRSTLFFGKLHWPIIFAYDTVYNVDYSTGKWYREVKPEGYLMKTFMQAHVVDSFYNLISNEIKASSEGVYNNVVVEYDGHQTPVIQADSDIRYDQQRTAYVSSKVLTRHGGKIFGGLRNFFTTEVQASIYGHSTVRDFMKDIYKGSYITIGEPSIKPYDVVYMKDHLQDMEGIHAVKAIHHSMDAEQGFISIVEPDAYVVNFDNEGIYYGLIAAATGRYIQQKVAGAHYRGSGFEKSNGIYSNQMTSSVMSKIFQILNHPEIFSYSNNLSSSYAAGMVRKTMAVFFREIAYALSDPTIAEYAFMLEDDSREFTLWNARDLNYYLENYSKSDYPDAVKSYIAENREIRNTIKKFKSNQKSFYAGINIEKKMDLLLNEAKEFSRDLYNFFKAYKGDGTVNINEYNLQNDPNYVTMLRENGLSIDDVTPEMERRFLEGSNIGRTYSTSRVIQKTERDVLDWIGAGLRAVAALDTGIINTAKDILLSPFSLLNTATSAIDQMIIMQQQNAQCVKVLPMTYKGSSFLAAMEGHRGGVWGDTPSSFDDFWNKAQEVSGSVDSWASRVENDVRDLVQDPVGYAIRGTINHGNEIRNMPIEEAMREMDERNNQ